MNTLQTSRSTKWKHHKQQRVQNERITNNNEYKMSTSQTTRTTKWTHRKQQQVQNEQITNNKNYKMNTSQTTVFFKGTENFLNALSANPTKLPNTLKGIIFRVRSLVVSDSGSKTKMRVWLLPMCRVELFAVITRLMSKCLWSRWK